MVQSHLMGGKDVQISANHDVNMQEANVLAGCNVNIDSGNSITLLESYDISNGKEKHEKSFEALQVLSMLAFLIRYKTCRMQPNVLVMGTGNTKLTMV
ncbi:hemagglutinin repeat-containing protein [Bartonella koehlerae]